MTTINEMAQRVIENWGVEIDGPFPPELDWLYRYTTNEVMGLNGQDLWDLFQDAKTNFPRPSEPQGFNFDDEDVDLFDVIPYVVTTINNHALQLRQELSQR
jgi:hypothetical protein